jgi:hypothetical protein
VLLCCVALRACTHKREKVRFLGRTGKHLLVLSLTGFAPQPTLGRLGMSHSKCQLVSIKVDNIKVPHTIVVILRWLDYVGSARG